MDMIDPAIERYAAEHTTPPPPHLAGVAAVTRERTATPQMRSGLVEARLLEALVVAGGATRVLEIGTFTGYGALSMAARLPAGGTVITIEADAELAALSRAHFEASEHGARIDLRVGDARAIVPALAGPFDLVFIDAWKPDYEHYYEAVLPKLADRGLIVCDNVLWSGQVLDESDDSDDSRTLRAFNDRVQADDRVQNALLTVGDGLLVIWRAG